MQVVVALIRGINVGGRQLVRMEELRKVLEGIGLDEPRTYIQSGNVVFRLQSKSLANVSKKIEVAMKRAFGFAVDVILRTESELEDVVARNPFANRQDVEPAKLVVLFLGSELPAQAVEAVGQVRRGGEQLVISSKEVFIHFPDGMGKAKMSMPALEKALGVAVTARNWNTVLRLAEMARESAGRVLRK